MNLKAGETRRLFFDIGPAQLQMLNADERWVVEPGLFRVMIGSSSRNLPLKLDLTVVRADSNESDYWRELDRQDDHLAPLCVQRDREVVQCYFSSS